MTVQHMTIDDLLGHIEEMDGARQVVVDSYQPLVRVEEIPGSTVFLVTAAAEAIHACVDYVDARRDAGDPDATAIMTKYADLIDCE
jgi:hypothetical protein